MSELVKERAKKPTRAEAASHASAWPAPDSELGRMLGVTLAFGLLLVFLDP